MTRSLRLFSLILALFASCVVSPQPSPPNLSAGNVTTDDQTGDIIDGTRVRGLPGAVDPAEGVVVGTNLDDATRAPVAEPVREDGSFEVIIPGSRAGELRVQARNGSARSTPVDFVLDMDNAVSLSDPRPLADCFLVTPVYELDFGDVRIGQSAEARVRIENAGCAGDLELLAPRIREAGSPFTAIGEATLVPVDGAIEIVLRVAPTELGAIEGTVFVEAIAPERDRRPLTLFVRGIE